MVEHVESNLWSFLYILLRLLHVLKKCYFMALSTTTSPISLASLLSWKTLVDTPINGKSKRSIESNVVRVEPLDGFVREQRKIHVMRRPSMLVIPCDSSDALGFVDHDKEKNAVKETQVEGKDYFLANRKGNRHVMEDGYDIITNINGDSKQAYFGVFDGHGGRAAVDFVTDNLGKNILQALNEADNQPQAAIKVGYFNTDRDFLSQGLASGACTATVLLKDGILHVANVGDCRVVLSRKGIANALTIDHRVEREDERFRIENLGGFVTYRNGLWRVQDSLAVSRSIGDKNLKQWITPEPETKMLKLTQDCEFLILASDGLWDKVNNQEAVDIVLKNNDHMKSCKQLVEISCSRGSRDDITVMVVNLQNFTNVGV